MNRRGFIKLCGMVAGSMCLPGGTIAPAIPTRTIAVARALAGPTCVRLEAMRALAKWVREKIDEDMIAALSGLEAA